MDWGTIDKVDAVVAIIAGLIGILIVFVGLIFRKRARPNYQIGFPLKQELLDGEPLKSRTKENHWLPPKAEFVACMRPVLPNRSSDGLVFFVPIMAQNKGNQTLRSVEVTLRYPPQHYFSDKKMREIASKRLTRVSEDGKYLEVFEYDDAEDSRDIYGTRRSINIGGEVRTTYQVGDLRPGTGCYFFEPVFLSHSGAAPLDGRLASKTLASISNSIGKLESVSDFFPIKAEFSSDDHKPMLVDAFVICLVEQNIDKIKDALMGVAQAFWFGRMLSEGAYMVTPGLDRLLYLKGAIGRPNGRLVRRAAGQLVDTFPLKVDLGGKSFGLHDLEKAQHGSVFWMNLPNFNVNTCPDWVDSPESLARWLGVTSAPKILGGPRT